jgi:hypothetical protein
MSSDAEERRRGQRYHHEVAGVGGDAREDADEEKRIPPLVSRPLTSTCSFLTA